MSYINEYLLNLSFEEENDDSDFEDQAFAYDYNEVQELLFNDLSNPFVILAGRSGLRKKGMLTRVCHDLLSSGVVRSRIVYFDFCLPMSNEAVLYESLDKADKTGCGTYLVINEIQQLGDWFTFLARMKKEYPNLRILASSSTPPIIYERLHDEKCKFVKVIVLSDKNASNIKYESQSFGVYNELKYNVKDGFVEIKGMTGDGKRMEHHTVPDSINGIPVKVIASGAFHDRPEMRSISLPDTIELIGDYAFSNCCNLSEIVFPGTLTYIGDNAFLGAKSLSKIDGGENVTHIGNSAFYDTMWLKSKEDMAILGKVLYRYIGHSEEVVIPSYVTILGPYSFSGSDVVHIRASTECELSEGTFYNCKKLETLNWSPESIPAFCFYCCELLNKSFVVASVGKFGLSGCKSVHSIKTSIVESCGLSDCTGLVDVDGLVQVGSGAFHNCCSLEECDMSRIRIIGKLSFSRTGIKRIRIASDSIGDYAFFNCSSLTIAEISTDSVPGVFIFQGCSNLSELSVSGSYSINRYFGESDSSVEKLIVHGDIVDNFSRNNARLRILELYDVKKFGRWSFYANESLEKVLLHEVDSIGDWAFAHCKHLETIVLPDSVRYIGMNAFRYCPRLSNIYIRRRETVLFGANAFYSTAENKKFYIPKGLKNEYEIIPIWSEYMESLSEY